MKAKASHTIKVIAIVGTTSSGKSDLAVKIARAVNGEVISADSRQVYTSLDLGAGKITKAEMMGVPHHLLDIADPRRVYTVAHYQKDATKKILDISNRGKVPIICGGTGFYIDALLKGIVLPDVPPNLKLRAQLEKKSLPALVTMLKKLDPARAHTIDIHNPRRLIRAIEIAQTTQKSGYVLTTVTPPPYSILTIGLAPNDEILKKRIILRLQKRLKQGMLQETIKLHKNGLSWKRMEAMGLEYRYMARFLKVQKQLAAKKDRKAIVKAHVEMVSNLDMEIWHYAKRQRTWFKRDKNIEWNPKNPVALSKAFLKKGPKMLG